MNRRGVGVCKHEKEGVRNSGWWREIWGDVGRLHLEGVDDVAQGFRHLAAVLVAHLAGGNRGGTRTARTHTCAVSGEALLAVGAAGIAIKWAKCGGGRQPSTQQTWSPQ